MAYKISTLLKKAEAAAAVIDGREETTMALALSVAGVALDPSTRIHWDKPLKSARVGLKTTADVDRFKQNLARLLPQSAGWIQAAPITPNNTLAGIADLVAAAKKSAAAPTASPTYGIPAIVVKGDLSEARGRVANLLGKQFADKVSDRFVYRAGLRMRAAPAADVAAEPTALILEFSDGTQPLPDPPAIAAREFAGLLSSAYLRKEIEGLRAGFYSYITTMRADMERRAAVGDPTAPATSVCWLNGTMQILGKPGVIADCAGDPRVERIGLPRLLEREMNVTVGAIGVPAFRAANPFDGAGIQVAVIDGECDAAHPALSGRIVHKNNLTREPWGTADRHATALAGILCSSHATLGGICPAATILNYKVFTTNPVLQGTDFSATEAIQSALEDGARIANLSWGLGLATNGESREARAVNRAWRLGLVLVKSAGNKGPTAGSLTSPADAADVIVVGATNRNGTAIEPYSSRGPNGARTGPDLLCPGASIGSQLQGLLPGGATGSAGFGTSLATPHVVGLIALLLQQNPALTPSEIRTLLQARCTPVGAAGANVQGLGFLRL